MGGGSDDVLGEEYWNRNYMEFVYTAVVKNCQSRENVVDRYLMGDE